MALSKVDSEIKEIIQNNITSLNEKISKEDLIDAVEPNSFDPPIGQYAIEVDKPFVPDGGTVKDALAGKKLREISLDKPAPFHKELTYVSPLIKVENNTDPSFYVKFSPKSSTGRTFLHSRTIADNFGQYDVLPKQFNGEVWDLIVPKAFNVYAGMQALSQARFMVPVNKTENLLALVEKLEKDKRSGRESLAAIKQRLLEEKLDSREFFKNHKGEGLTKELYGGNKFQISVSTTDFDIIGYESLNTNKYVDMTGTGLNNADDFFRPIRKNKTLSLEKGRYYILATKELFTVPKDYCIEITPSDHNSGEFRLHFAGFVDSLFGYPKGNILVLEIYAYENCEINDGKVVGWAELYKNTKTPDKKYGDKGTSNYVEQKQPKLAKYFKDNIGWYLENDIYKK